MVDDALVADVMARLPELPLDKRGRFVAEMGLSEYAAGVLVSHPRIAAFFDEASMFAQDNTKLANFVQSELLRDVTTSGLNATFPVSPRQVADLVNLVEKGVISGKQAKQVYAAMRGGDRAPAQIVDELGMKVISDEGTLLELAQKILADNPAQVASYRAGKTGLLGYFVGQLMKATRGAADPKVASQLLETELAKRGQDGDGAA
jgi:aspartyl-tRNA(Asn)/glutamyl-tRNA(Gln) amidotransferase subunit B